MSEYPWLVRIILWAQKNKYGESLLPTKIWGRSPKITYGLQALYRAIDRKNSPLEPALRSLISVKVSQINNCEFCVDISNALLLKKGVPLNGPLSPKEKIALEYAEAVTKYDQKVDTELFTRVQQYFNDDEIVELTALIAYQNLSSKFNAALDIPNQGFCLPEKERRTFRSLI